MLQIKADVKARKEAAEIVKEDVETLRVEEELNYIREVTLDYPAFISELTKLVKLQMGEQYTVRIVKVLKNNSLELDSMVLLKEGKNYAPNIYLQSYYEAYLEGTFLEVLANRICMIYSQCTDPIVQDNFTFTLQEMKENIIYRLVSYDRNKVLLEKIPHIKYLDLAITFHCLVRDDEDGIGTIRITNEHVEHWNTNTQELYLLAIKNTERLFPASIRTMEEVLRGMFSAELSGLGEEFAENQLELILSSNKTHCQHRMYILTNQKGINGASCLLYRKVLKAFADQMHSDFYILPSSIHELILIPCEQTMKADALSEMVRDVNRTQVAEDEVLSDRVYYYSRESDAILM